MKTTRHSLILFFFLVFAFSTQAQKSNTISLTYRLSTAFNVSGITEAGDRITTYTNNSQYLSYNIRKTNSSLYCITAAIYSGTVPAGMDLYVELGPFTGSGQGGQSTGRQLMTTTPKVVVANIPNVITGWGQYFAHEIIIDIECNDFGLVHPGNYPITLIYTLGSQ